VDVEKPEVLRRLEGHDQVGDAVTEHRGVGGVEAESPLVSEQPPHGLGVGHGDDDVIELWLEVRLRDGPWQGLDALPQIALVA